MQEKQIKIDDLAVNYKIIGDGNIPIILLHGWGVSSDKYVETANYLVVYNPRFQIIALDLPGFGKSSNPLSAWGVDGYAEYLEKFINVILPANIKYILIGHSFGGQISIKFAIKYPNRLRALILTGAAGVRHLPGSKQKIFYIMAKTGKIIFSLPIIHKLKKMAQKLLYKAAKEKDYYEARGIMKEVFKRVVSEDLLNCLEKITIPTLLVWGAKDRSTPLADGRLMANKIQSVGSIGELKIINEANHSLPYQYPEKFAKIVVDFVNNQ